MYWINIVVLIILEYKGKAFGQAPPMYSNWSFYGPCTKACDGGVQQRQRACLDKTKGCKDQLKDFRPCNNYPCGVSVNGKFSTWSTFSACSTTCNKGFQIRTRKCDNPKPVGFGQNCIGPFKETKVCNIRGCPVNGGYSTWSNFGSCSQSCGTGVRIRSRLCNNPLPANGGKACNGASQETKPCTMKNCPVDGKFSNWSDFGTCSKSCNGGTQIRTRNCDNPKPENGGKLCQGRVQETRVCSTHACPVDGKWSSWTMYSRCSTSCDAGVQRRTRSCSNPSPKHNGKQCTGNSIETKSCTLGDCPVDGKYSQWSGYSPCSTTCGPGSKTRTRVCNNPPPGKGGKNCVGLSSMTTNCNLLNCPVKSFIKTEHICEHTRGRSISCPNRMIMTVLNGFYGRTSMQPCSKYNGVHQTGCVAGGSFSKIRNLCNGKTGCYLSPGNHFFGGDPCRGVGKYIEIRYRCQ